MIFTRDPITGQTLGPNARSERSTLRRDPLAMAPLPDLIAARHRPIPEHRSIEEIWQLIETRCVECPDLSFCGICRRGADCRRIERFLDNLIWRHRACERWDLDLGPPRLGFCSPGLGLAGAEIWIASLLRYLDRSKVTPAGVAIGDGSYHPELLETVERLAPVYRGPESYREIADRSNVLVNWGLRPDRLAPLGFHGRLIVVSHGTGAFARRLTAAWAKLPIDRAAVSEAAAMMWGTDHPVTVIPNGIDRARCEPRRGRDAIRRDWGVAPEEIAVGSIGRVAPTKAPTVIAWAVHRLGRPYRVVLAGDSPKAAETASAVRQITPNAVILPGVFHVGDILAGLDCFVLPSPAEAWSLALAEAWYAKVPTVATRVGAVPELEARHGQLTVPIPVGSRPPETARAIQRAISPHNRGVIHRAHQVVLEHYTAERMADRWAGLLGIG